MWPTLRRGCESANEGGGGSVGEGVTHNDTPDRPVGVRGEALSTPHTDMMLPHSGRSRGTVLGVRTPRYKRPQNFIKRSGGYVARIHASAPRFTT